MKKLIVCLTILLLCGCGYDEYKVPEELTLEFNHEPIEVFEDHTLNDLVKNKDIEILNKDELLKTNKVGTHLVTMKYKYNKRKYKYDIKYEIIDTVPPVYISASSIRTVIKNQDLYPCENIVFGDNYDRKPTCEVVGEYDLTTTGVYNVEYVLKDSSNNENRKKLKINVVDKISHNSSGSSSNNKPSNLPFDKVIEDYKTDETMVGIDVSRWQGDIDWESVKNAGVEFVIMRIGVQSGAKQDISVDSFYKQNIKGAKEAGLRVGVYVYTTAINNKTAKSHAKWVIDTLDGVKLDFPIAYDWENWQYFNEYNISIHDLSEAFNTFTKEVEKHGYDAMLYSSKFYLENIWMNKNNEPVWLAHYTNKTNYEGKYILWQLSNKGRVPGINGDVDINVFYK